MKKVIYIWDNYSGKLDYIKPFLDGENMEVVSLKDWEMMNHYSLKESLSLMLVNLEVEGNGLGKDMEILLHLRKISSMPLIVVSKQTSETAKIMALNAGADDYVTMDCNPLELLARIKSQLRRYMQLVNICEQINHIYKADGLEVNDLYKSVSVDGKVVKLTPIEYKILRLLMQQRGRVFSNDQIYETIWNERAIGAENTVAVHIRHIREKIEENPKEPRYLKVVWGSGYKVV